jgi:drug/metabolite transporter (DMT)-like permease
MEGSAARRHGLGTAPGYVLAIAAACVSGVSVFVNSLGVRSFADPVLYTTLKDGLVGLAFLVPLIFSTGLRAEYRRLDTRKWAWLVALALTGGSVPFALFYSGLQISTASTGALINHFQFVLVALLAAAFLKERLRPAVWAGMLVLLIGTVLGTQLDTLQWNAGALLIAGSTILFAIDFVIAKYLLRDLATLTVMTARLTLGTAMLLAFVVATDRWVSPTRLSSSQVAFVLVTGGLLLLFTVTTFAAIRSASVSTVLAIGAAAPLITIALQVVAGGQVQLAPAELAGLALTFGAASTIIAIAIRYERRSYTSQPAPRTERCRSCQAVSSSSSKPGPGASDAPVAALLEMHTDP